MTARFTVTSAWSLVKEVHSLPYFHPHEVLGGGIALPGNIIQGSRGTKLIVVLGDNASGKSFWRRLAQAMCATCTPKIEPMRVSMEDRSADSRLYGPARALIYGTEEWESTGQISASTVLAGFNTARNRMGRHVLILDEPDLGCSEGVALGIGREIAIQVPKLKRETVAVAVISHSRLLLRELAPLKPHVVWLGENPGSAFQDWLDLPVVAVDPAEVAKTAHATLRRVTAVKDYYGV